jgi:hypothetical protein
LLSICTLRVNYRTSHQIRTQADRLLGPMVTDVDGNGEDRSDTVSVFTNLRMARAYAGRIYRSDSLKQGTRARYTVNLTCALPMGA